MKKQILRTRNKDFEAKTWSFAGDDYNIVDKIELDIDIFRKVGKIADELGVKVFAVGGFVRDYYLDVPDHDYDFTVIGDSLEFAKAVAFRFKSKAILFERFRTAMVPVGDLNLEFVGTRKEKYKEHSRKPEVTQGSFMDDLKRRDFTVNAMAMCINEGHYGEIIDQFNGLDDLKKGILITPLDPHTTYIDDPLRMMRAARFAAQLGFEIEQKSFDAISETRDRIEIISQERISDEFLKLMRAPKPSVGLKILYQTGLMKLIFPDLHKLGGVDEVVENGRTYAHKDVFYHTLQVVDNLAEKTDDVWLRFSALMHDIAKSITKKFIPGTGWSFHGHEELGARRMKKIFRDMKFPMDHLDYVEKLVRLHQRPMVLVDEGVSDSAVRRLAFQAGDALEDLFALCKSDITTKNAANQARYLKNYDVVAEKVMDVQEKDKLREFQSPVRGEEIMELSEIKPCQAVGYIKTQIEEAILDGLLPNEYEEAKEFFLVNKVKWLKEADELGYVRH
jgi:poly(A) polymerase